jgi:GMP synthase-like glutamine amidotransferase
VPLLVNESCPNQAFRLGDHTYAFQAHIEASPERMASWLSLTAERLAETHPGLLQRFAADAAHYEAEAHALANAIGAGWLGLAQGRAQRKALDMGSDLDSYY